MLPSFLFPDKYYVRLYQILEELKYKLQDVRRIKISVDIELGLPLLLGRKMMYFQPTIKFTFCQLMLEAPV
jgi:hypothetical protein